jgi:hypothetical protein
MIDAKVNYLQKNTVNLAECIHIDRPGRAVICSLPPVAGQSNPNMQSDDRDDEPRRGAMYTITILLEYSDDELRRDGCAQSPICLSTFQ